MITQLFTFTNAIIFFVLSMIHVYWAFGGKWAIDYTIPESYKEGFFNPDRRLVMSIATIIVALGLLLFSFITLSNTIQLTHLIEQTWIKYLTRAIGLIFILRAIGDFNVCGLFKKELGSIFAKKDNQFYIPLCIYLGTSSILLSYLY